MPKFRLLICILITLSTPAFAVDTSASNDKFNENIALKSPKIEIQGIDPGGQFGHSIAIGDVDGDGKDDLAISSPGADAPLKENNGKVSIFLSGKEDIYTSFFGAEAGEGLGSSLFIGDLNGDKIDDLVMGSYKKSKVYIYFGKNSLEKSYIDLANSKDNIQILEIKGTERGDEFGTSLDSLDVDNDGIIELLIGAPKALEGKGAIFNVSISEELKVEKKLLIEGQYQGEGFGSSLDSFRSKEDYFLAIGAPFASTKYVSEAGSVYLYKNKTLLKQYSGRNENDWLGFSLRFLKTAGAEKNSLIISNFPFKGDHANGYITVVNSLEDPDNVEEIKNLFGSSLSTYDYLDFENDSLVVGNPLFSGPGGKTGNLEFKITENFNAIIYGDEIDDWFGYAVETLDFNNDGTKDLIVSARYADNSMGVDNGTVYILLGQTLNTNNISAKESDYTTSPPSLNDVTGVARGEALSIVVKKLDLKKKNADFIKSCYAYLDFCFFNFSAMSSFNGLQLKPDIILYPDVDKNHPFYEDILTGTMLGVVNGYMETKNSPFLPEKRINRIEALKIVLAGAELVPPNYKFELIDALGSYEKLLSQTSFFKDISSNVSHMWWYPRYVNFAYENNLVSREANFRPEEPITRKELEDMVSKTSDYLKTLN